MTNTEIGMLLMTPIFILALASVHHRIVIKNEPIILEGDLVSSFITTLALFGLYFMFK